MSEAVDQCKIANDPRLNTFNLLIISIHSSECIPVSLDQSLYVHHSYADIVATKQEALCYK